MKTGMEIDTLGDPTAPDLVCILGWGNRLDHENVRWLLETFTDTYRVHAIQIPTVVRSFEDEYLAPVREYVAALDGYRVIGHSTGGLIAAYLTKEPPVTRTYLSPWWEMRPEAKGALLDLVCRLPVARPVVPVGAADREALGSLATDRQIRDGPSHAAPTFLRESRRAHAGLAGVDPDPDAVAFCTLRDRIVDARQVGRRVSADRIVLYDGGHELFSSAARDSHRETLVETVRKGPRAL